MTARANPSNATEIVMSKGWTGAVNLSLSNWKLSFTARVSGEVSTSEEPLNIGKVFSAIANACAAGLFK